MGPRRVWGGAVEGGACGEGTSGLRARAGVCRTAVCVVCGCLDAWHPQPRQCNNSERRLITGTRSRAAVLLLVAAAVDPQADAARLAPAVHS